MENVNAQIIMEKKIRILYFRVEGRYAAVRRIDGMYYAPQMVTFEGNKDEIKTQVDERIKAVVDGITAVYNDCTVIVCGEEDNVYGSSASAIAGNFKVHLVVIGVNTSDFAGVDNAIPFKWMEHNQI